MELLSIATIYKDIYHVYEHSNVRHPKLVNSPKNG